MLKEKLTRTGSNLHSGVCALSCLSQCQKLDKIYFCHFLCWDAATVFANVIKLLTSFVFLQQSEVLYWENKLDKEFKECKQQNRVELLAKESDTVTLLIISVVFQYFQLNFLFPTFLPDMNQPMFCNTLYFKFFGVWFCYF